MKANVETFIQSVKERNGRYDRIVLKVECPLDSGFRLHASGFRDGEVFEPKIPPRMRPIFEYVAEKRRAEKAARFNVLYMSIEGDGGYKEETTYDAEIQRIAEEDVRP